ncbi:hypothetical protein, partial [Paenibacillus taihuensis]|uniref:hypothetical protein n=1 Tax=Paenibacillus taihuensis TaxID=1156355 RepID=UPI001C6E04CF
EREYLRDTHCGKTGEKREREYLRDTLCDPGDVETGVLTSKAQSPYNRTYEFERQGTHAWMIGMDN